MLRHTERGSPTPQHNKIFNNENETFVFKFHRIRRTISSAKAKSNQNDEMGMDGCYFCVLCELREEKERKKEKIQGLGTNNTAHKDDSFAGAKISPATFLLLLHA